MKKGRRIKKSKKERRSMRIRKYLLHDIELQSLNFDADFSSHKLYIKEQKCQGHQQSMLYSYPPISMPRHMQIVCNTRNIA